MIRVWLNGYGNGMVLTIENAAVSRKLHFYVNLAAYIYIHSH